MAERDSSACGASPDTISNVSTVTVSGIGITLSNVSYSGDVIFIQIDVAANAALGPRTVTVTNSNLDTSVLSGGIIIK